MNPIFRREFSGRWRNWHSHLLLLALALLLGGAAYWTYQNALGYSPPPVYRYMGRGLPYSIVPVVESAATRGSRAGHALFVTLAVGNVGAWFVLAPLLLATGVARERERGLLESLQLSPMRPASQIVARTLSALSYLGVLQLVTLPVYLVAFSFGGVSQEEILRVWAVVAAAAFCGVGLGLALSSQSPRPSGALFGAVAILVVWTVASTIGNRVALWSMYLGLGGVANGLSQILSYGHPVVMVWNLCEPSRYSAAGYFGALTMISSEEALPWALLGWFSIGALGLAKATRDVTRALPPSSWAGRNTLIQKWKNRREKRLAKVETRRSKVSVEGALLADFPFERLIRFKNPLLNREVKGRFRLRRASGWVWTGRTLIFLAGAGVWVMVLFSVFFDPPGRPGAVPTVLWSEWFLGIALVGTFAASSFAREREAGTWEGVQLSLLSPGEIAGTKWASPLIAFAVLSCPLWVLLFALLPMGSWGGVPLRWVLLGGLVVASSLCWISALGSWISVRAKTTAGATCWTIGVLLALFTGGSLMESNFHVSYRLASWHYGMPDQSFDDGEGWDSPQYLAVYEKETGYRVQNTYSQGRTPNQAERQELGRYQEWFQQRAVAVSQFHDMIGAWSPVNVLSALEGRGKVSYNRYSYNNNGLYQSFMRTDETVAEMAVLHILLAGAGTLVLLAGVRTRLVQRLE